MVDVLVILDGASDAPGGKPQTLDVAATPNLDRLARDGERYMREVLPDGVPVGSETAIASLLGWTPDGRVNRGRVEAAARGVDVGSGEQVWRVDLTGVHKLLVISEPPLPLIESATTAVRVWPDGTVPPRILDESTVVIGAYGAATGLGALMGAAIVVPDGATGAPGSDLAGKRQAALAAIAEGARRVVVHFGGPDEAGHQRDRAAKIAAIEAADQQLIGPLTDAVRQVGGMIEVCPDHGCDPETGKHVGGPVPCVTWRAARPALVTA